MGGLILGVILEYMVSASFSCFLWLVKSNIVIVSLFSLRYNTKHFNDEDTPKSTKEMLK